MNESVLEELVEELRRLNDELLRLRQENETLKARLDAESVRLIELRERYGDERFPNG